MLKDFKEFAIKGNVIDMAVGIIIGAAFSTIVKSLVDDIIMPPIGWLLGKVDFSNLHFLLEEGDVAGPYATIADAQKAGAITMNYGLFINAIVSFLIVSFTVFLVVRSLNKLKRKEVKKEDATTKDCQFCFSSIPIKAIRCPKCTSQLD